MARRLVQIVAGLPPKIDGVGDYALTVARAMRAQHGIDSLFVVADPAWQGPETVDGFHAITVEKRSPGSLVSAIERVLYVAGSTAKTPVLLHCSLYGYAQRALAFWLINGILRWKRKEPETAFLTMFHELAAWGPIWSSPFWLYRIQRGLIKTLANESNAHLTTNARYLRVLGRIADLDEKTIVRLPALSTVGELSCPPPAGVRKRQLVVFGQRPSRDAVFSKCRILVQTLCRALQIERIIEIGPPRGDREDGLLVPLQRLGILESSDVSRVLQESLCGLLALDADYLAKSSVFAAYCAHGVLPIVAGSSPEETDGLKANEQYWHPASTAFTITPEKCASTAQSAHLWYQGHTAAIQAGCYAAIIAGMPGERRDLVRRRPNLPVS